jgi:hypothetical protein
VLWKTSDWGVKRGRLKKKHDPFFYGKGRVKHPVVATMTKECWAKEGKRHCIFLSRPGREQKRKRDRKRKRERKHIINKPPPPTKRNMVWNEGN